MPTPPFWLPDLKLLGYDRATSSPSLPPPAVDGVPTKDPVDPSAGSYSDVETVPSLTDILTRPYKSMFSPKRGVYVFNGGVDGEGLTIVNENWRMVFNGVVMAKESTIEVVLSKQQALAEGGYKYAFEALAKIVRDPTGAGKNIIMQFPEGLVLEWNPRVAGKYGFTITLPDSANAVKNLWPLVYDFIEHAKNDDLEIGASLKMSESAARLLLTTLIPEFERIKIDIGEYCLTAHALLFRINEQLRTDAVVKNDDIRNLVMIKREATARINQLNYSVYVWQALLNLFSSDPILMPLLHDILYTTASHAAHTIRNKAPARYDLIYTYADLIEGGSVVQNLDHILPPSHDLEKQIDSITARDRPNGGKIVTFIRPPVPIALEDSLDASTFYDVVLNAYTNALRYGNRSAHIFFTPAYSEGLVVGINLHVVDDGIGIENLSRFGEMGFREERRAVRGSSGIGVNSMLADLRLLGMPALNVLTATNVGTDVVIHIPLERLSEGTRTALVTDVELNWGVPCDLPNLYTADMPQSHTHALIFSPDGERVVVSGSVYILAEGMMEQFMKLRGIETLDRNSESRLKRFFQGLRATAELGDAGETAGFMRAFEALCFARGYPASDTDATLQRLGELVGEQTMVEDLMKLKHEVALPAELLAIPREEPDRMVMSAGFLFRRLDLQPFRIDAKLKDILRRAVEVRRTIIKAEPGRRLK